MVVNYTSTKYVGKNEKDTHYFSVYPGHPSEQNFRDFYRDKRTFFSKDLPDMYKKWGNRRMESNGIFYVCCEALR